jgi:hypothetical protein
MVKELIRTGLKDHQRIQDHVCAAFGNLTETTTEQHSETLGTFGMYKISKSNWCNQRPTEGCGIPCSKLVDDDVKDDIICAEKILRQAGTNAFSQSKDCNDETRKNIQSCISDTKYYTRCEFVNHLLKAGINNHDSIQDHICAAFGHELFKSSKGYRKESEKIGIYDISRKRWCDQGPDKGCGIPCSKLNDDDITDDIECASKILRHEGTNAFFQPKDCSYENKKEIKVCIDNQEEVNVKKS